MHSLQRIAACDLSLLLFDLAPRSRASTLCLSGPRHVARIVARVSLALRLGGRASIHRRQFVPDDDLAGAVHVEWHASVTGDRLGGRSGLLGHICRGRELVGPHLGPHGMHVQLDAADHVPDGRLQRRPGLCDERRDRRVRALASQT